MNLSQHPDYFHCESMRATIKKSVCRDRQLVTSKQGENSIYISCRNCEQGQTINGEAIEMKQRGKCTNCERDGLMLQNYKQYDGGLCGSCQKYIAGVTDPQQRKSELKLAREKYKGEKVKMTGPKAEKVVDTKSKRIEHIESEPAPATDPQMQATITLLFKKDDILIYEKLKERATRKRRTIEQQALWTLETCLIMNIGMKA